jgi:hypothetical protein
MYFIFTFWVTWFWPNKAYIRFFKDTSDKKNLYDSSLLDYFYKLMTRRFFSNWPSKKRGLNVTYLVRGRVNGPSTAANSSTLLRLCTSTEL